MVFKTRNYFLSSIPMKQTLSTFLAELSSLIPISSLPSRVTRVLSIHSLPISGLWSFRHRFSDHLGFQSPISSSSSCSSSGGGSSNTGSSRSNTSMVAASSAAESAAAGSSGGGSSNTGSRRSNTSPVATRVNDTADPSRSFNFHTLPLPTSDLCRSVRDERHFPTTDLTRTDAIWFISRTPKQHANSIYNKHISIHCSIVYEIVKFTFLCNCPISTTCRSELWRVS